MCGTVGLRTGATIDVDIFLTTLCYAKWQFLRTFFFLNKNKRGARQNKPWQPATSQWTAKQWQKWRSGVQMRFFSDTVANTRHGEVCRPHVSSAACSERPTETLIRHANNLSTAELGTLTEAALHVKHRRTRSDHAFLGSGWGRVQGEGLAFNVWGICSPSHSPSRSREWLIQYFSTGPVQLEPGIRIYKGKMVKLKKGLVR